jgi:hypothetical protein
VDAPRPAFCAGRSMERDGAPRRGVGWLGGFGMAADAGPVLVATFRQRDGAPRVARLWNIFAAARIERPVQPQPGGQPEPPVTGNLKSTSFGGGPVTAVVRLPPNRDGRGRLRIEHGIGLSGNNIRQLLGGSSEP